jgi:hypothetical protein
MRKVLFLQLIFFSAALFGQSEECTIGVASGAATPDGRPMIWKTRDYTEVDNEVRFNPSMKYDFIFVAKAGSSSAARMGVNEHGLAIVNSTSSDLPDGSDTGLLNGELIRDGLGNCLTVEEFEDYLDETNLIGRRTNGNFAVIDSTGAAAIFEVGEFVYWRFDASDADNGYVLRTNFAVNGGGYTGKERLIRTVSLVNDFYSGDTLTYKSILRHQMRDFSDYSSRPISLPFDGAWGGPHGYIPTNVSICRSSSVSASVIHGVLPTEFPGFSTMWTMLGQPATAIALPYWPIGYTPAEANGLFTAPLNDVANLIRSELFDYAGDDDYINTFKLLDGNGGGLWTKTFPYEDLIISGVNTMMESWRTEEELPISEMRIAQDSLAKKTHEFLLSCLPSINSDLSVEADHRTSTIYPNPYTHNTVLSYTVSENSTVSIDLYSISGVLLDRTVLENQIPGDYQYKIDSRGIGHSEGVLVLKLSVNNNSEYHKIIKTSY